MTVEGRKDKLAQHQTIPDSSEKVQKRRSSVILQPARWKLESQDRTYADVRLAIAISHRGINFTSTSEIIAVREEAHSRRDHLDLVETSLASAGLA